MTIRKEMRKIRSLPNIITASRGVAAIAMLCFPVFSIPFWILYSWCGFSDMIDGALARKLGSVSGLGTVMDSLADLLFVICSAILVLPTIDLPLWVWLWIAAIGLVKLIGIIVGSSRRRKLTVPHSMTNRLTGILLFCLPFAIVWLDALIPTIIVCISATASLFEDFRIIYVKASQYVRIIHTYNWHNFLQV